MDEPLNVAVKMAFLVVMAHQLGVHHPATWVAVQLLPWTTIACMCVSVAALFGAFHKVFLSIAAGLLWALVVLGSTALVVFGAVAFAVIQFGSAEKSERLLGIVSAVGNAIIARIIV